MRLWDQALRKVRWTWLELSLKSSFWHRRMLPGLNSAAVGLIVGAVFSLTFQIYKNSPFPTTSICIGE